MVLIDTHCHLGSRQFDSDREEVISRMLGNDVSKGIIICCGEHDLREALKVREQLPGFKLACSVHPQDLEDDTSPERIEKLRKTIIENRAEMIGETGLDYRSHPHTKEAQKVFFEAQLRMASDLGLPVDVHTRRASLDTLETLKKYPVRGIIHSYSGSSEMAELYVKQGFWISFGASVLFKGAKKPAQVISKMPLEKLFVETDAPYQSPVPGNRHEPADILAIYEKIADIRGISLEGLADRLEENWYSLFGSEATIIKTRADFHE